MREVAARSTVKDYVNPRPWKPLELPEEVGDVHYEDSCTPSLSLLRISEFSSRYCGVSKSLHACHMVASIALQKSRIGKREENNHKRSRKGEKGISAISTPSLAGAGGLWPREVCVMVCIFMTVSGYVTRCLPDNNEKRHQQR